VGQLRAIVDLPATTGAPRMARRIVGALMSGWELASLRVDAELVASELVANALMHAPGADSYEFAVIRRSNGVRLSLADGSSIVPVVRALEDARPGGRGLRIMQSLAAGWGHDTHDGGKRVWVDLAEPDRPSTTSS
jgi:anti-sigma regulatory factor (Ser/Thr protein kinase)